MNSHIGVAIDLSSLTVLCKFHNQQDISSNKSCIIEYGPSDSCESLPYSSQNSLSTSSTVTIDLLTHPGFHNVRMYCFTVTATNGSHTIKVDGKFNTSTSLFCT